MKNIWITSDKMSNKSSDEQKTKVRSLLQMSQKEADYFMKSFDLVICDCEGVLWQYDDSIPETGLGVMALKLAGKQVKFISNNSVRSDADYLSKLRSIGITDVRPNDIITPGKVMMNYLKTNFTSLRVFSLCSSELNEVFRHNGIKVDSMEPATNMTMQELIQKITPDAKISAVLYDLNFNLSYVQLAKAQQYLCMDNCTFLVSYLDTFVPVSKDFSAIGTAGIVSILRENSGKEPVALGKSGTTLGEEIINTYNIRDPSRVLFIGDNLFTDVPFGHFNGFQTLFVTTGVSTEKEISMLLEQQKPDYTTPCMSDFVEFFEKYRHGAS